MCIWLANLIAVLHGCLILLNLAGALAVARGRFATRWPLPLWQKAYLAAATAVSLSGLLHGDCLLTAWEKQLRGRVQSCLAYEGSFMDHYFAFVPQCVAEYGFVLLAFAALLAAIQASRRWIQAMRGEHPRK